MFVIFSMAFSNCLFVSLLATIALICACRQSEPTTKMIEGWMDGWMAE
jgi:hypothetical protein